MNRGVWENSDKQMEQMNEFGTPSFENFMALYHMFSQLVAAKLEGKKYVNVRTLEAFITRRRYLNNDDRWCYEGTISNLKMCLDCQINTQNASTVVEIVEDLVLEQQFSIACKSMKHANFVFLCCINKLFYKDIRRLLYEFVEVANDDELEIRAGEVDKFRLKYCR